MSVVGVILGVLLYTIGVLALTRPLVDLVIPQSEIDKIDAIGKWAKEELDRREYDLKEEEDATD